MKENPYRVRRSVFSFHTMNFPYQVTNLLCNEFITSNTFLLDFVNNRTFVNNKTSVGRLKRMAGNVILWRAAFSCMTSQQYLSNVIPVRFCYLYVKSQQKGCLSTNTRVSRSFPFRILERARYLRYALDATVNNRCNSTVHIRFLAYFDCTK